MYAEYLAFNGYRVVTAMNGRAAVEAASVETPALIFMDIRMPVMTGVEALHLLRTNPTLSSVPIIALTAHALEDERAAAMLEGFDDVIVKPCIPDELVAAARRWLAAGRSASA